MDLFQQAVFIIDVSMPVLLQARLLYDVKRFGLNPTCTVHLQGIKTHDKLIWLKT